MDSSSSECSNHGRSKCRKKIVAESINAGCITSQITNTQRLVLNGQIVDPNLSLSTTTISSTVIGSNPSPPDQKALNFPSSISIPQGVFTGTAGFPVLSSIPNYVSIMSTEVISEIAAWSKARLIESEIVIQNQGDTTLNVAFVLYVYSRNLSAQQDVILDMDVHTLRAGDYSTFRLSWYSGKSGNTGLPLISDVRSVAIHTAVMIINQTSNLANLVTFQFATPSLSLAIRLTIFNFTGTNVCNTNLNALISSCSC